MSNSQSLSHQNIANDGACLPPGEPDEDLYDERGQRRV